MPIRITPYLEEHTPAVIAFNRRLREGGAPADFQFSESHIPHWLPPASGSAAPPIYNEFFLAREGDAVRGTYVVKHQDFSFYGDIRPVPFYHHPFSEGIVNKTYTPVGLQMMMHVTRAHPVLYALGMAGYDRPLPRMLIALKWRHCLVPFYFRVVHPARFLRQMRAVRNSPVKRFAADAAALTGAGWAAIHLAQRLHTRRVAAAVEVVPAFGEWADDLWQACSARYAMIGVRNSAVLNALYPASNNRFIRFRITDAGNTVGWAAATVTEMKDHEQYGNLRTGVILDCLALPENAAAVIGAAARVLEQQGVDIITSNQSHRAWIGALKSAGFLAGPSNYIFAASPKLSEWLQPFDEAVTLSHLTRGDGDNLMQYANPAC